MTQDQQDRQVGLVRQRTVHHDQMPRQARAVSGGLKNADVLAIAVELHNQVADPATGEPYSRTNFREAASVAFGAMWTAAQEDAARAAVAEDRNYRAQADQARELAAAADGVRTETERIPDQTVEGPSAGQLTRREVEVEHARDRARAERRDSAGDHRHGQRPVSRWVILLAAVLYGLLDLILLLVPILNLGPINGSRDLLYWILAIVLVAALAVSLDLVLNAYHTAERECTDRRDALHDHNRDLGAGGADTPAPETASLEAADERLRRAQIFLVLFSALTGILAGTRITILAREAGRAAVEAALFGAAVGVILAVLILVLGRALCRGNALGERLRTGGDIVEETDRMRQDGLDEVARGCDAAQGRLRDALTARAQGAEKKADVHGIYWEGIQIAAGWLDYGRPPTAPESELLLRDQPMIATTDEVTRETQAVLDRLGRWLEGEPAADRGLAIEAGSPSPDALNGDAPDGTALVTRARNHPVTSGSTRIHGAGVEVPEPPREPRMLIGAGLALTVVAAVVTAVVTPDGGLDVLALGAVLLRGGR